MDPTIRDNFFSGLRVKIMLDSEKIVEGVVKEILTMISIDPLGIYVKLETGEVGNTKEILETENEIEFNRLTSEFIRNLHMDETQVVEFKETFSYPTNPEKEISEITRSDKKKVQFYVAKTIAAFANSVGGTLYIGVRDRTKEVIGLDRDYQLLRDGRKDADGLGVLMKSSLEGFFGRRSRIFEYVKIRFIQYNGADICVIKNTQSDMAFIPNFDSQDHFFVRHGDTSLKYTANDFLDYWPKHLWETSQL